MTRALRLTLLVLCACYLLFALLIDRVFDFQFFQSDVAWYWKDRLEWRTPFNPYHVPGYPLLLAALDTITLRSVHPVALMMAVNLAAVCAAAVWMSRSPRVAGREPVVAAAVAAFGLWPFVGMPYAVMPLADVPAMALFIMGVAAWSRGETAQCAIWFALAMLFHKAMWVFVPLTLAAGAWPAQRRRALLVTIAALTPLAGLWFAGWRHYKRAGWLFDRNIELREQHGTEGFVPFGAVIDTVATGAPGQLFKAALVAVMAIAAVALAVWLVRRRHEDAAIATAIAAGFIVLIATLPRVELWAAMRFSRLLALPLAWWALSVRRPWMAGPWLTAAALASLGTQAVFAWYATRVYFR